MGAAVVESPEGGRTIGEWRAGARIIDIRLAGGRLFSGREIVEITIP
jgi:hypothetical protein